MQLENTTFDYARKIVVTSIFAACITGAGFASASDVESAAYGDRQAVDYGLEAAAASSPPVHKVFEAGPHTYKKVITYIKPQTTSSEKFVNLPGAGPDGKAYVPVPPFSTALINVQFGAESRCSETAGIGEQNWCETRILIGGVEADPAASSLPPHTYAFDGTDNGNNTFASWESHSMDRHRCVRNTTGQWVRIPVQVQWKVTNHNGGAAPSFWLDDWSLVMERADRCKVEIID